MKVTYGLRIIENNNIVKRWMSSITRIVYSQGKRVSKDCELDYEERRIYVRGGKVKLVKYLMDKKNFALSQAKRYVDRVIY